MASNKTMSRENGEQELGLSMVDVLEEEEQLEADANAVLGASDDKNCTYPQGYMPRQALYACVTCTGAKQDSAGVCLACSYECHESHDLYELYTKRNFRCDCGNSKFSNNKCKLYPMKEILNIKNCYNQNFQGLYCTCSRPYPDPEDDTEDEMIQCVICEDWCHGRHLEVPPPPDNDFGEMICKTCMRSCPFLWAYHAFFTDVTTVKQEELTENNSEAKPVEQQSNLFGREKKEQNHLFGNELLKTSDEKNQNSSYPKEHCIHSELQKLVGCLPDHVAYWPNGWRTKLCRCSVCKRECGACNQPKNNMERDHYNGGVKAMYDRLNVSFLLDEKDQVCVYEEEGMASQSSQYDKGLQELSKMDRVQQVEVIQGFNEMKAQLKEYFKTFAESKKVVREEDIREFFDQMEAKKRQKISMPYFCK